MSTHKKPVKLQLHTLEDRVVPATITWNSDSDGLWSDPTNWDLGREPTTNDVVIIDRGTANPVITIAANEPRVRVLSDETVVLTSTGQLDLLNGSKFTSTLQIDGNGVNSSGSTELNNVTWLSGPMNGSGTYKLSGTMNINGTSDRSLVNIRNEGNIVQNSPGLTTITGSLIHAGGSFDMQAGTMRFDDASGNSTGANFNVASGALLEWIGSPSSRNTGSYTGTGDGRIVMLGQFYLPNDVTVTWNFAPGLMEYQGGNILVFNQTGVLVNIGEVHFTGATSRDVNRLFINKGVIRHSDSGNLSAGGTLQNEGLYLFDGDGAAITTNFVNSSLGTIRKIGPGFSTFQGTLVHQSGTVDVQAGTMRFDDASGNSTGANFNVASGALLEWIGSPSSRNTGSYTGTGDGRIVMLGQFYLPNDVTVTWNFAPGLMEYQGGNILVFNQTGVLVNIGEVHFTGATSRDVNRLFINKGVIRHSDSGNLSAGGTLQNEGLYLFDGDGAAITTNFVNSSLGTIRKIGPGFSTFQGTLVHQSGTVDVQAGTMRFDDASGNSTGANFNVASGALLEWIGSPSSRNTGSYTGTGDGRIVMLGQFYLPNDVTVTWNFAPGLMEYQGGNILVFNQTGVLVNIGEVHFTGATSRDVNRLFINKGVIRHSDSGNLSAGGTLQNEGLYLFDGVDAVLSVGTFNNLGTVHVSEGRLQISSTITQDGGSTLLGGNWIVAGTLNLTRRNTPFTTNQANVTLIGPNAQFPRFALVSTNVGSLTLDGSTYTTTANFTNQGTLALRNGGSLNVPGELTLAPNSTLDIGFGGRADAGLSGTLNATGAVNLGGTLNLNRANGFVPVTGDNYVVGSFGSRNGDFADIVRDQPIYSVDITDTALSVLITPSIDLVVESVMAPLVGVPGQAFTFSYTVRNLQPDSTTGNWIDSIYLSKDGSYSPDDLLVQRVSHQGGVAGNGTYTETVTTSLPGVVDGNYRIIVIADSRKRTPDRDRSNNSFAAADALTTMATQLNTGVPISGAIAEGQDIYYRLDVTTANRFALLRGTFATSIQAEILIGFGRVPTRSNFDGKAGNLVELQQQLLVNDPAIGTFYILIHGREGAGAGQPYTIAAEVGDFLLLNASPTQGGDKGTTTITLNGAGFDGSAQLRLRDAAGVDRVVTLTQFVSSNTLIATVDLRNLPRGTYSMILDQGSQQQQVNNDFTVVEGIGGRLDADLIIPASVRITRFFPGSIVVTNTGDADLSIPLLNLSAPADGALQLVNGTTPQSSLQFLALPKNGARVLTAGQSITLHFEGQINQADSRLFVLGSRSADSTTPFDVAALRAEVTPSDASTIFNQAFDQLVPLLGTTYTSYISALTDAALEARSFGQDIVTVRELINYMLDRAASRLSSATATGVVTLQGSGSPVGPAAVSLVNRQSGEHFTTGAFYDGRFSFSKPIAAGLYDVLVSGFDQTIAPVTIVAGTVPNLNIQAVAGVQLSGRVVTGRFAFAVSEATLILSHPSLNRTFITISDAQGNYSFTNLPALSGYTLRIESDRYVPVTVNNLDLSAAGILNLSTTVETGARLLGTVRAADTSLAAEVEVIVARAEDSTVVKRVTTNANGSFLVKGLAAGNYILRAQSPGQGDSLSVTISVAALQLVTDIQLSLQATGSITGIVRDADTIAPIVGALVTISDSDFTAVVTDANGMYTIPTTTPGSRTLEVTRNGFIPFQVSVSVVAGTSTTANATLSQGGRISGVVLNPAGTPVVGVIITLANPGIGPVTRVTDGDGRFSFDSVRLGNYTLFYGPDRDALDGQQFNVTPAQLTFDTTVQLQSGISVTGTVLAADGITPLANVTVSIQRAGRVERSVTTNAAGQYQLTTDVAGVVDIVAIGPGVRFTQLTGVQINQGDNLSGLNLTAGSQTLTVNVGSTQTGQLMIEGASILIEPLFGSSGISTGGRSDANGLATIANLLAGDYRVTVSAPELIAQTRTVTLSTGSGNVTVDLISGTTLQGRCDSGQRATCTWGNRLGD